MKITMTAAEAAKIILAKVVPVAPRPDGDYRLRWILGEAGGLAGVEIDIGEKGSMAEKPAAGGAPS